VVHTGHLIGLCVHVSVCLLPGMKDIPHFPNIHFLEKEEKKYFSIVLFLENPFVDRHTGHLSISRHCLQCIHIALAQCTHSR
jgi:hypothetical protein